MCSKNSTIITDLADKQKQKKYILNKDLLTGCGNTKYNWSLTLKALQKLTNCENIYFLVEKKSINLVCKQHPKKHFAVKPWRQKLFS